MEQSADLLWAVLERMTIVEDKATALHTEMLGLLRLLEDFKFYGIRLDETEQIKVLESEEFHSMIDALEKLKEII